MTENELELIEYRWSNTQHGSWQSFIEDRDHGSGDSFIRTGADDIYLTGSITEDEDFIASAKQDIPALIA
jgi:hypothetical protein